MALTDEQKMQIIKEATASGYKGSFQELFDQQSKDYRKEILSETDLVVSIEAAETNYWKRYVNHNGLCFGINDFGKSAPYKEIFNHFSLNQENIIKKIKQKL